MLAELLPVIRKIGAGMREEHGEDTKNYVSIAFIGSKKLYKYGTVKKLKEVDWSRVRRVGVMNTTADGDMNEFRLLKFTPQSKQ